MQGLSWPKMLTLAGREWGPQTQQGLSILFEQLVQGPPPPPGVFPIYHGVGTGCLLSE